MRRLKLWLKGILGITALERELLATKLEVTRVKDKYYLLAQQYKDLVTIAADVGFKQHPTKIIIISRLGGGLIKEFSVATESIVELHDLIRNMQARYNTSRVLFDLPKGVSKELFTEGLDAIDESKDESFKSRTDREWRGPSRGPGMW